MALHVGLRYPASLLGLLILSGYFVLGESVAAESHGANAQTPVFCAHGTRDGVLPYALGRQAYEVLEAQDRPSRWEEYPMGHEVCPEQIGQVAQWLQERFEEAP